MPSKTTRKRPQDDQAQSKGGSGTSRRGNPPQFRLKPGEAVTVRILPDRIQARKVEPPPPDLTNGEFFEIAGQMDFLSWLSDDGYVVPTNRDDIQSLLYRWIKHKRQAMWERLQAKITCGSVNGKFICRKKPGHLGLHKAGAISWTWSVKEAKIAEKKYGRPREPVGD